MARRSIKGLSNPQLVLNNKLLAVVPGSYSSSLGRGETTHRRASTGGRGTVAVISSDAGTFKSMVKFELYTTAESRETIDTAKLNLGNNTLEAFEEGVTEVFTNFTITNDPEFARGADTTVSVEAEADPINE